MKVFFTLLCLFALPATAINVTPIEFNYATFIERHLVMLDSEGNEKPVKAGDSGRSPFGIWVVITPDHQTKQIALGYCTATHLKGEHVALAAHCIPKNKDASVWLVFYGKDGKKQIFPVYDYFFKGEGGEDIAMAKLHPEAIALWDDADFRVFPFESAKPDPDIGVQIWSYSPINHFPKWEAKYPEKAGMVWAPNRCIASQLMPRIEGRHKILKRKTGELVYGDHLNPKRHLFIDHCQHTIVQGNSGSLITHGNNFSYKLGVLHSILGNHDQVWKQIRDRGWADEPQVEFFYIGAAGKPELIDSNQGLFSVGAGTLFEVIEKRAPSALPRR